MTGTANNDKAGEGLVDGLEAQAPAALRLLLEKAPIIVWTTDRELRLTATAGAGLLTLGRRAGVGVGQSLYEFVGDDVTSPAIAGHLAALRGETCDFEIDWRGRLLAVRVAPARAGAGVIGVALDMTEQREAERIARQRESDVRDARRADGVVRGLRARIGELEDLMTAMNGVSERLTATVGSAPSLSEIDHLRRASLRGIDVVRAMGEGVNSADRDVKSEIDASGGETILLVDDEPQVRGFVRRALEDQGYRVLEAGTVEEALSIGAAFEGRIHLLLTDVVLPGQNGTHLAARLAPVRPDMRILYMTGYADDAIVDRGVLSAGQALLVKPFTSLGLAHGVKKALRS